MLSQIPKFTLRELKNTRPNPLLINAFLSCKPIIIEGQHNIKDIRRQIIEYAQQIEKIELEEYGAHMGILKRVQSTSTHQNPIQDFVPPAPGVDPLKFPESHRTCKWPELPGYKELMKDTFKSYIECAIEIAGHIDAYIQSLNPGPEYQSLEDMTRDTLLATCRNYLYRERREEDIEGENVLNWHYDRVLQGGMLKDFYLLGDKVLDDDNLASMHYNLTTRGMIRPIMQDGDLMFHNGMSTHILTGGIIKAHCHGVIIPKVLGMRRIGTSFFMQPPPETVMHVPFGHDLPSVPEHDVGFIENRMGYKQNYWQNMKYREWSESMMGNFVPVFGFRKRPESEELQTLQK